MLMMIFLLGVLAVQANTGISHCRWNLNLGIRMALCSASKFFIKCEHSMSSTMYLLEHQWLDQEPWGLDTDYKRHKIYKGTHQTPAWNYMMFVLTLGRWCSQKFQSRRTHSLPSSWFHPLPQWARCSSTTHEIQTKALWMSVYVFVCARAEVREEGSLNQQSQSAETDLLPACIWYGATECPFRLRIGYRHRHHTHAQTNAQEY